MTTTAGSLALAKRRAPQRRLHRRAAARGRRGDSRQDQPERVGELPLARARPAAGARAAGRAAIPYALDRNTCGSSSGSGAAIAANLARSAVGHRNRRLDRLPVVDTAGSSASSRRVGLVSRTGIVPIAHSQDTAGPMTRTRRRRRDAARRRWPASTRATPRRARAAARRVATTRIPRSPAGSRARASAIARD